MRHNHHGLVLFCMLLNGSFLLGPTHPPCVRHRRHGLILARAAEQFRHSDLLFWSYHPPTCAMDLSCAPIRWNKLTFFILPCPPALVCYTHAQDNGSQYSQCQKYNIGVSNIHPGNMAGPQVVFLVQSCLLLLRLLF